MARDDAIRDMNSPDCCYICGMTIAPGEGTDDHRVQKFLQKGAQPRRAGYDYGGVARTHRRCNNEFREEASAGTALRILSALHHPKATVVGIYPDDPTLTVRALNSEVFGEFSEAELRVFNIRDGRSMSDDLPSPQQIRSGKKTNLERQAVPIALSVLLKSSIALLIDRHNLPIAAPRHVWATPWTCGPQAADELRADGFKPFHEEVFWKVTEGPEAIEVRYFAHGVLVFFWLLREPNLRFERAIIQTLPNADHWLFRGTSLNDLRDHPWRVIHQSERDGGRNLPCSCGSGVRFKHCHGVL